MGLLEEDAPLGSTLTNMLQGLNRFLLDRFSTDYRNIQPRSPTFDQVSSAHWEGTLLLILKDIRNFSDYCY